MVRSCALLLAVLAGTTQVAALLHFTLVPHERCPEHGEWIELGPHTPSAHVDVNTGAVHDDTLAQSSAPATHGHDHCPLSPFHVQAASLHTPAPATALPFAPPALAEAPPGIAVPCGGIALLLHAPKTSPPA